MSHSIQQTLRAVKPHIPLIKFRKGGLGIIPGKPAKSVSKSSASSIDESSLPPKYQRKPVTGLEMEMIERGGPDI